MSRNLIRTVSSYLTNQEKVLLLYHDKYKKWVGPGGKVEKHELVQEAAVRELYEESGFNCRTTKLSQAPVSIVVVPGHNNDLLEIHQFIINVNQGFDSTDFTGPEGHQLKWITIQEALTQLDLDDNVKSVLEKIKQN